MNHQEIFDTVLDHLAAQKCRSTQGTRDACAYRGADGRKCAAGILIPDACYDPAIDADPDGIEWDAARGILMENLNTPEWLVADENSDLICDLQGLHDIDQYWDDASTMWECAAEIAKRYGLNSWKVDTTVSAIFPGYRHKVKA